ncbi:hypothetical protein ACFE04_004476 [Oxalis oulophora]
MANLKPNCYYRSSSSSSSSSSSAPSNQNQCKQLQSHYLIFDYASVRKLKGQFAHFYVVVTLPNKELNDSFVRSYFKYSMELGKPTFVPVQDLEMGFEKLVKIAHSRGACKQQDVISKLKVERKRAVENIDIFLKVMTSIPGIDKHDALSLSQTIGSIEAIAKATKKQIMESTDLSADKAETITRALQATREELLKWQAELNPQIADAIKTTLSQLWNTKDIEKNGVIPLGKTMNLEMESS